MTITHADIFDCFTSTVNNEFFCMIAGRILGAGQFRIVYEHEHRDDLVLKFEPNSRSFQNIAEWDFWNDNKNNKRIARWLAPCEFISSCGIILAMKKTIKPQLADYPNMVPEFLADLKRNNFGLYEGRLVAHDYGLYNVNTPLKRRKADWWGNNS